MINKTEPIHKVIAFDVFGTVVDWYSSIKNYLDSLNLKIDTHAFTIEWRQAYQPAIDEVMQTGKWITIDDLHLNILKKLLKKYNFNEFRADEIDYLNKIWHRLEPWEDSIKGIQELKKQFIVCSLSNGNISLLTNMAKYSNIPWDCILSAEVFQKYKPHKDTYLGVAEIFKVKPQEVLMVATHDSDLYGAKKCGLSTAYIYRPEELGPISKPKPNPVHFDYYANSISELNDLLLK